jgi:hypothetical protein
MRKQDAGFDYNRYRNLLSEAVDEPKRLALIDLLSRNVPGIGWRPSGPPIGKP